MRTRLLAVLLFAACQRSMAPAVFDVTGSWGFEGAVPGHSQCGFYALATLVGSSRDYTGTAQLETTVPNSPIGVDVTGNQRSMMLGSMALTVERQQHRRLTGSYQCEGATGFWSVVRYP